MYPERFQYLRPTSLKEAIILLDRYGSRAKILAGGQSLIPMLKLKLVQVETIVDIKQIQELGYIRQSNADREIVIGSTIKHAKIADSKLLKEKCPILSEAAGLIGHPNIRNRGTIGGSLSHADPAADYTAPIIALEAKIEVVGPNGARSIRAEDFFTGPLATSMTEGEILVAIHIPNSSKHVCSTYQKFEFFSGDFALVNLAMVITMENGICKNVRLVTSAGLDKPIRLKKAEQELEEKMLDRTNLEGCLGAAVSDFSTGLAKEDSERQEYQLQLLKVLIKRGLGKIMPKV